MASRAWGPLVNATHAGRPAGGMLAPLAARARSNEPRVLAFNHLHTGERLELEYFSAGAYVPDALGAVNHLLRDFRTGDVGTIDPALLDLLHALRDRSRGVATKSLHMSGQAIDIRLADVPLVRLRDTALSLRVGGVGFYPGSDFVHVDTGRGRAW